MRAVDRVEDKTVHISSKWGCCSDREQPPSPSLESARMPDALHHSVWLTLPSEPTTPGRHHFMRSMKKGWCEPLVTRSAAQLRRTSDRRVVCGHGARIRTLARLI